MWVDKGRRPDIYDAELFAEYALCDQVELHVRRSMVESLVEVRYRGSGPARVLSRCVLRKLKREFPYLIPHPPPPGGWPLPDTPLPEIFDLHTTLQAKLEERRHDHRNPGEV